jgi:hypothetical protein
MDAEVRHIITVKDPRLGVTLTFEFESRDIGATQGTTLWYGSMKLAQYRPGTRHWSSALETAVEILKATAEIGAARAGGSLRAAAALAVDRHPCASAWSGDDHYENRSLEWGEMPS